MGWEQRRGRVNYYRSKREGGRVVREYVGIGQLAEVAAELDEEERAERQAKAAEQELRRIEIESADPVMRALHDGCELVVQAALEGAGFHRHKGQWRRRRGQGNGDKG